MMKIIDRILLFIRHKNLSMRAFDMSINVGNGYTSKQTKSKASVGSDVIEKILDRYPDLNPLWLITGDGNMIVQFDEEEDNRFVNEPPTEFNNDIDKIIDRKIELAMKRHLKMLLEKLDAVPTMDDIRREIKKSQKNT